MSAQVRDTAFGPKTWQYTAAEWYCKNRWFWTKQGSEGEIGRHRRGRFTLFGKRSSKLLSTSWSRQIWYFQPCHDPLRNAHSVKPPQQWHRMDGNTLEWPEFGRSHGPHLLLKRFVKFGGKNGKQRMVFEAFCILVPEFRVLQTIHKSESSIRR